MQMCRKIAFFLNNENKLIPTSFFYLWNNKKKSKFVWHTYAWRLHICSNKGMMHYSHFSCVWKKSCLIHFLFMLCLAGKYPLTSCTIYCDHRARRLWQHGVSTATAWSRQGAGISREFRDENGLYGGVLDAEGEVNQLQHLLLLFFGRDGLHLRPL